MYLTKLADVVTQPLLEYWWGGEVKDTIITAIILLFAIFFKLKGKELWEKINRS